MTDIRAEQRKSYVQALAQKVLLTCVRGSGRVMINSRGAPTNERSTFRAGPHVLLMGSDARVTAAIAGLRPHLPSPVVHWHPVAVMEPPPASGTLVIWELDALDGRQQALLLLWMDSHADVVVISVARRPVFPSS